MRHTHSVEAGPWLYPKNRKLNQEQEETMYGLRHCFKNNKDWQEFAYMAYGTRLTVDDMRRLKDRMKRAHNNENDLHIQLVEPETESEVDGDNQSDDKLTQTRMLTSELAQILVESDDSRYRNAINFLKKFTRSLADTSKSVTECVHRSMRSVPESEPSSSKPVVINTVQMPANPTPKVVHIKPLSVVRIKREPNSNEITSFTDGQWPSSSGHPLNCEIPTVMSSTLPKIIRCVASTEPQDPKPI